MRNFFGIFLLMFIFCSQLSAQKQLTLEDFLSTGLSVPKEFTDYVP